MATHSKDLMTQEALTAHLLGKFPNFKPHNLYYAIKNKTFKGKNHSNQHETVDSSGEMLFSKTVAERWANKAKVYWGLPRRRRSNLSGNHPVLHQPESTGFEFRIPYPDGKMAMLLQILPHEEIVRLVVKSLDDLHDNAKSELDKVEAERAKIVQRLRDKLDKASDSGKVLQKHA